MRWFCFQFWFVYRLTLACLAHLNWLLAIYVNCAFFMLWKSYDLFWFWMHLTLCTCFKPLRTENYLIVWCALLHKKCTKYPDHSFKQIYLLEYGRSRKTKCERELDQINAADAVGTNGDLVDGETNFDTIDGQSQTVSKVGNVRVQCVGSLAEAAIAEEQRECMEQVLLSQAVPSSGDIVTQYDISQTRSKPPIVPARRGKPSPGFHNQVDYVQNCESANSARENQQDIPQTGTTRLGAFIHCVQCRKSSLTTIPTPPNNQGFSERITRYIPLIRQSSLKTSQDSSDNSAPNLLNQCDRSAKEDQKELNKRIRAKRRAELAIIAKREAREKTISNAIELLLQLLRMVTSFAILVGNIRKTFIPAQFKWIKPGRHASDNLDLMLFFRFTVFLDVLLFWTNVVWAYCLQWHLCCRLGLIKFWMWVSILVITGGFFMILPMSVVQSQLDISWCRFQLNSSLTQYQPQW